MEEIDLSHAQKRILVLNESDKTFNGNIGGELLISKYFSNEMLLECLDNVIGRHTALHVKINTDKLSQRIQPDFIPSYEFYTVKNIEEKENLIRKIMKEPILLQDKQLFRVVIITISSELTCVLLVAHHIIIDGWGLHLFQKDIIQYIEGNKENNTCSDIKTLVEEEKEYLFSARYEKDQLYWHEKFKHELTAIDTYYDYTTEVGERSVTFFDKPKDLKKLLKDLKISESSFFLAVYILTILKLTKETEIIIGIPCHNRTTKETRTVMGMNTSIIPFHFCLNKNEGIDQLLKRLHRELKQAFIHQKYPYNLLMRSINQKEYIPSIYKYTYNYFPMETNIEKENIFSQEIYTGSQAYSLQYTVKKQKNGYRFEFDFKQKDFSTNKSNLLMEKVQETINDLTRKKPQKILKESESILALLESSFRKNAHKIAIVDGNRNVTYQELAGYVSIFQQYIIENINSKDVFIPICMNHSLHLVVAILGTLFAGKAFVPIDPIYPNERILELMKEIGSDYIFVDNTLDFSSVKNQKIQCIDSVNVIENPHVFKTEKNSNSLRQGLAYMIYTSGSTGKPKGVKVTHQNFYNYIKWAKSYYIDSKKEAIDEEIVVPLFSSISFDLTLTSIFLPLISGGRMIIFADRYKAIEQIASDSRLNFIKATPTHFRLLNEYVSTTSNIKSFVIGGENLPSELCKALSNHFGNDILIYNEYGPTEATVGCMIYDYNSQVDQSGDVPIGKTIPGMEAVILDDQKNELEIGKLGTIHLYGRGVTKGYFKNYQHSIEKFSENPYSFEGKLYDTGDLAKKDIKGNYEFFGRKDKQFKIRGVRVDPSEIERAACTYSEVKNAKAILKNQILSLFVLTDVYQNEDQLNEIKQYLSKKLPPQMLPNRVFNLQKFPSTHNGKIDEQVLISYLEKESIPRKVDSSENDSTQKKILKNILKKELKLSSIKWEDNFFEVGGDSIKAIMIISQLKKFGIDRTVYQLMTSKTLQDFLDSKIEVKTYSLSNESFELNTSMINEFFQRANKNELFHHLLTIRLSPASNKKLFRESIRMLILRHEMLRAKIDFETQKVTIDSVGPEMIIELDNDITSNKDTGAIEEIKNFRCQSDWLFTVFHWQEKDIDYYGFLAHHLITDLYSWRIFLKDLFTLLRGRELAPIAQFRDWQYYLNDQLSQMKQLEYDVNIYKKQTNELHEKYQFYSYSYCENSNFMKSKTQKNDYSIKDETQDYLACLLLFSLVQTQKTELDVWTIEVSGRKESQFDKTEILGWFTQVFNLLVDNEMKKDVSHFFSVYKKKESNCLTNELQHLKMNQNVQYGPVLYNFVGDSNLQVFYEDSAVVSDFATFDETIIGRRSPLVFNVLKKEQGFDFQIYYAKSQYTEQQLKQWLKEAIEYFEKELFKKNTEPINTTKLSEEELNSFIE